MIRNRLIIQDMAEYLFLMNKACSVRLPDSEADGEFLIL